MSAQGGRKEGRERRVSDLASMYSRVLIPM